MTGSDREPEKWKPIPDGPGYEASTHGNFRSLDRVTPSGRSMKGQPIATTTNNRGYVMVKYRNAKGERVTKLAHVVVLEAHDKPCPPGMEARHYDDDPRNNRFVSADSEEASRARGGNLFWGTKQQNREDRRRNTPSPPPRPPRECVRCQEPFQGNGRRCHPCVVDIAKRASEMLAGGKTLADAMKALDYPSAEGLHLLAVRYGGYGARKSWLSRTVKPKIVTLRKRLPGKRRSRTVSKRSAGTAPKRETPAEGRKSICGFPPKPGQTGTLESRNVAERDHYRDPPLPADLTQRDRPRRATRRNR